MSEHENKLKEGVESASAKVGAVGNVVASGAQKLGGESVAHPVEAAKLGGETAEYGAKVAANILGGFSHGEHESQPEAHKHNIGHKVRAAAAASGHGVAAHAPVHSSVPAAPAAMHTTVGASPAAAGVGSAIPHPAAPSVTPEQHAAIMAQAHAKVFGDKRLAQNRAQNQASQQHGGTGANTAQNHQKQWMTRRHVYGPSGRGKGATR